jgi:hypothetical protein
MLDVIRKLIHVMLEHSLNWHRSRITQGTNGATLNISSNVPKKI